MPPTYRVKTHLEQLLLHAARRVRPDASDVTLPVVRTRERRHGYFTSSAPLALAKLWGAQPRALAEALVAALPASEQVAKVEVAGPGFVNFFLRRTAYHGIVRDVLEQGAAFGQSRLGAGIKLQIEFVSANPTGPLHVGHGRGAAYGASLAALLETAGYAVHREYYVNDAGRQMDILAASVWLRYLELCGESIDFPHNGYQGDYVWDIAADLHRAHGVRMHHPIAQVCADLPPDAPAGDKEIYIDAVIARTQELLGLELYRLVFERGLDTLTDDIRRDLGEFGVHYDGWYSERSLAETGAVARAVARLEETGHTYLQDGALWFRASAFGDEKYRVLVRDNGQTTYFASDIAYHLHKFERGFEQVIDVWGADHHGYVPRIKAALTALGLDAEKLTVLLVQFAVLYRGTEKVQMSTRSGEFVTLRALRHETGNDAARFFYVLRKSEQHLDFDLDLAQSNSNENPVYYIHYAHARVCSVLRQLAERGWTHDTAHGLQHMELLDAEQEDSLLYALSRYPEVIETAARDYAPHQIAYYLRELAHDFHQ